MRALLVLATQAFDEHPGLADADALIVVEAEDRYRRLPFHRHKIALLLAAQRHVVARARARGIRVAHVRIDEGLPFTAGLDRALRELGATELSWMSATDSGVDARLTRFAGARGLATRVLPDALFLTPADVSDAWFAAHPKPLMEDFYRAQRRRSGILMTPEGQPVGARWNFDHDNRHPLPKEGIEIPPLPPRHPDPILDEVLAEVDARFADHPGRAADFWLPVTPEGARAWLADFCARRLRDFGRFEDAMHPDESVLFHSVVSPLLNIGLLTPTEVVDAVLAEGRRGVPLASLEGFLRQVIGWREYLRGVERAHPELHEVNGFGFDRELEPWWYSGEGVPGDLPFPVRRVLERVIATGYAHHIERLMVLGNWFLQQEYDPRSVTRWFTAMFVDAYPWVMAPNVSGMSQYADGGLVATKPYLSGGAYLQKMGRWWRTGKEATESAFTSGYWRFLQRNAPALEGNHRMAPALAQARSRPPVD